MSLYKLGLDVGSTTAKCVVNDLNQKEVFSIYIRHNADIQGSVLQIINAIKQKLGDIDLQITLSGSAAMGLAERNNWPFVQEVVALNLFAQNVEDDLHTIIDIGGEDSKIIFLQKDSLPDMRMNGNCAGGTGAFIDQMSVILNLSIEQMDTLAQQSDTLYPIASRCGVFSKTDVQNLVAKNIALKDIAHSIFHAISVQVVSSLSRGKEINKKILFAGGPLTFIKSLRDSFIKYLNLDYQDIVQVSDNNLLVAKGCTYYNNNKQYNIKDIIDCLTNKNLSDYHILEEKNQLPLLFSCEKEYDQWLEEKNSFGNKTNTLQNYCGKGFLGIDSGSTTTKIVVCNEKEEIIFKYYNKNNGKPIQTVIQGLKQLKEQIAISNCKLDLIYGSSTGYGEDLIKAAFNLKTSTVETLAHYFAAKNIQPKVDFILDIGGQDMKAMYIEDGVLSRIELNEACSSGCGSFIETFAKNLGYSTPEFATKALFAPKPCDLGTRCTVFMNSKVKQFLREGESIENLSSGLSFSVVRNCLYKVLKLEGKSLGTTIVVQGGTMKNDSIVRALEILLNQKVFRSNDCELMGAYGCSLKAKKVYENLVAKGSYVFEPMDIESLIISAQNYTTKQIICKGCENHCLVSCYKFQNNNTFYSGHKCEKIFTSLSKSVKKGENIFDYKNQRLFIKPLDIKAKEKIGIPRALNMYENYPFWVALFEKCGIEVCLSEPSSYNEYEKSLTQIMSENICFPAKLSHSHIDNLIQKGCNHIFFPYIVYEQKTFKEQNNSYNCPIVSSYNIILKYLKDKPQYKDIKFDNPVFSFKDLSLLKHNCKEYLTKEFNIPTYSFEKAFAFAIEYQKKYHKDIIQRNNQILNKAKQNSQIVILLASRPYHTDMLIQHSISQIATNFGVSIVDENICLKDNWIQDDNSYLLDQWTYINKIENAAFFVGKQSYPISYCQLTSFGCGPDAFVLDDVKNILTRFHKSCTFIKIDDIQNTGSLRLRIRSLVESIKLKDRKFLDQSEPFVDTLPFDKQEKTRKILAPFFTNYISPFLPELFKINGYELENLPMSDNLSAELGLQYANNEVCYPATLIVGDIIKALKSGNYDRKNIAIGITQTGGQCRASNYYGIIRKALVDSGFEDVPVISVSFASGLSNRQKGFKINWLKTLPLVISAMVFGDCLSRVYYSTVVRLDKDKRLIAKELQDFYINKVKQLILKENTKEIEIAFKQMITKFNDLLPKTLLERKKIGIVGEIYLKYHSFANHNIWQWFVDQDIEILPPCLTTFFVQTFINHKVNKQYHTDKEFLPKSFWTMIQALVQKRINKFNSLGKNFMYFSPLEDIEVLAQRAKTIIPLYVQFGEGWLLPGEIVNLVEAGVNTIVSLQPFGCIANHIISKGVENKIKAIYPQLNYLAIDFDNSVSEVNIKNRLMLLLENQTYQEEKHI